MMKKTRNTKNITGLVQVITPKGVTTRKNTPMMMVKLSLITFIIRHKTMVIVQTTRHKTAAAVVEAAAAVVAVAHTMLLATLL